MAAYRPQGPKVDRITKFQIVYGSKKQLDISRRHQKMCEDIESAAKGAEHEGDHENGVDGQLRLQKDVSLPEQRMGISCWDREP